MRSPELVPDLSQLGERPIGLLIADDDPVFRSLLAMQAKEAFDRLDVHEAADGAEAITIALQRRPQLALLDVNMPRVDGIEAAVVLRALLPELRLAVHSGEAPSHIERAGAFCLPLFDKFESARTLRWLGSPKHLLAGAA
jgi:CheY-like chemotaxis protein